MNMKALIKKIPKIVMFSFAVLWMLSLHQLSSADDKYWIDQEVNCDDYCSSDSAMHWGCAIGYDFSGFCELSTDGGLCRLVGYCSNREEDGGNSEACEERRSQADEFCAPNTVSNFFCDNVTMDWGFACEEPSGS
jgi:hypothetical protein